MIKNWYTYSIPDLESRRDKLVAWLLDYPKHEKRLEVERVLNQICHALQTLKDAQTDPAIRSLVENVLT